jgi:hypothetical protein
VNQSDQHLSHPPRRVPARWRLRARRTARAGGQLLLLTIGQLIAYVLRKWLG